MQKGGGRRENTTLSQSGSAIVAAGAGHLEYFSFESKRGREHAASTLSVTGCHRAAGIGPQQFKSFVVCQILAPISP